jgi:Raf kinase inhibitor-like YbhB/YbcL family protein
MNSLMIFIMATVIVKTLTVKSPAFSHKDFIPSKYTCDGINVNPELDIEDIPAEAKSLVLIMDDPDAPNGTFDHWIMWNIPLKNRIEENSSPGAEGKNGKKENKYTGPCPPHGTHHYHFKVYALDTKLDLPISTDKAALLKAMDNHIVAEGELIGVYKRTN